MVGVVHVGARLELLEPGNYIEFILRYELAIKAIITQLMVTAVRVTIGEQKAIVQTRN